MKTWETEEGVRFLRKVGIEEGQTVLDFGCRVGRYSIPGALLLGRKGIIYAVDKDKTVLRTLKEKAETFQLPNIKLLYAPEGAKLHILSSSVDTVLLYDVLHYMERETRTKVYAEMRRVLSIDGLLSVYAKHIATDGPLKHFQALSENDVRQEIERSGFLFETRICGTLSHDDSLNQGCILNFKKKEKEHDNRK